MTDTVTPEVRSRMMAAIKGKDTKPELAVRRSLHALGFRYSLHADASRAGRTWYPEIPRGCDRAHPGA
ncbi:hypothetical protein [Mesorhizobium sp. B2-4-17]|uniref:hypothetical protein n=1 Tax=Mesorhizobium sp. B2-4-17 TaxID=2589932 RepID=UPI001AEE7671|nr:hypothetical protein [Mesorhizobium sp. B2-4-17]